MVFVYGFVCLSPINHPHEETIIKLRLDDILQNNVFHSKHYLFLDMKV